MQLPSSTLACPLLKRALPRLLEPRGGIVRLISFLRKLFTRLTMIQSHVESMFQTLFGLSIRVLPSY
jgi:hypothetical protein